MFVLARGVKRTMRKRIDPPIYGVLTRFSMENRYIQEGMHFCFDGKTLTVYFDNRLDPTQLMEALFSDASETTNEIKGIVEGRVKPSDEYAAFHISCRSVIREHSVALGVVAYWILYGEVGLGDIGRMRFEGECVDSFCPMTNLETDISKGRYVVTATTCEENVIDLGTATIAGKSVAISAEAFWVYDFRRNIQFKSCISVDNDALDYDRMKRIYISVASALRFCLGRGNVDFEVILCRDTSEGWETAGEFTALHGKTYVPDEYDGRDVAFVRAHNIGNHFSALVSAFDSEMLEGKALSESREDSQLITLPKVIELTSSFEHEFREVFPEGIKHGVGTQRVYDRARKAILDAAEELPSDSKRILKRLSDRVEDDSLEARIRYACKKLPQTVCDVIFEKSSVNGKNARLGKKITTMRNDIAHGNKPRYDLGDIREEYKLLINLVFIMRLLRVGIPDGDAVRLLKAMS